MKIKKLLKIFLILCLLGILFVFLINKHIENIGEKLIVDIDEVESTQVALVLGSRVWSDGRLSDVYRDRVKVAIALYEQGKVEKILVSGDHGRREYDEVNAARKYLLESAVAPEDIFLDHAGFDTYDSVYRASKIFGIHNLVIVTQAFHLPRALYIAESLGLDAVGVSASLQPYVKSEYFLFREKLARVKAFLNIILNSSPQYLGEKININKDGRESW